MQEIPHKIADQSNSILRDMIDIIKLYIILKKYYLAETERVK